MKEFFNKTALPISLLIATSLAIFYTDLFLIINKYSLGMPDALARMNIARRVIDNLTPGIAQIGGIWLPLPQVFYIPLVQIDFLYRTGLAGAIVNGLAFVLGAYFIFKIVEMATQDRRAAFISGIAYSTSTNLLYFQTTAMTEATMITFLLGGAYYLFRWAKYDSTTSLFKASLFIVLITLTRYEGYAVLFLSFFIVLLITFFKHKRLKKIESTLILFITPASFGFFIWSLYLWLIFGDPIYWLRVYTHQISTISTEDWDTGLTYDTANAAGSSLPGIGQIGTAFNILFHSTIGMNGIILVLLGSLGAIVAGYLLIKKKQIEILTLLILFGPILFLLMNLVKSGSGMIMPQFTWSALFDKSFVLQSEFNSRYALQSLPIFVIFVDYLAHRLKMFSFIIVLLLLLQFSSGFTNMNLVFALQKRAPELFTKYKGPIEWLNKNYDGGKVLSSVLANDAMMFHLQFPYKTFIFEGNDKYWTESLDDPTRYATWVMFKNLPKATKVEAFTDRVAFSLQDTPILLRNYDLVYEGEMLIYKIKDKPKYVLP